MKKSLLTLFLVSFLAFNAKSQCFVNPANVLAYNIGNKTYGVVKEAKTWSAARACALQFSGKLAIVESQREQDSIFAILNRSGISNASTTAPDGGGAAYVWLGGNDRTTEGNWIWDSYATGTGQFWLGARTGTQVGGLYNNWGNEPDNFNNQDALGFALSSWPFGVAGEWNDVDENNNLYFIVEYPGTVGLDEVMRNRVVTLSPNPTQDKLSLNCDNCGNRNEAYQIFDVQGRLMQEGVLNAEKVIDVRNLKKGSYFLQFADSRLSLKFQKD
jgi:hypothetical protein